YNNGKKKKKDPQCNKLIDFKRRTPKGILQVEKGGNILYLKRIYKSGEGSHSYQSNWSTASVVFYMALLFTFVVQYNSKRGMGLIKYTWDQVLYTRPSSLN